MAPHTETLDTVADLVSEEQWLGSRAARESTSSAPAAHAHCEDRLHAMEEELDRCSDPLHPRRGEQQTLRDGTGPR